MTPPSSVVLDASVAVRALVDSEETALAWLARVHSGEVPAAWPDLALVEIAHALTRLVRANRISGSLAERCVAFAVDAPIRAEPVSALVGAALALGLARGLSASGACYVVLAEASGATLVTADRRLAAATQDAVLVSG